MVGRSYVDQIQKTAKSGKILRIDQNPIFKSSQLKNRLWFRSRGDQHRPRRERGLQSSQPQDLERRQSRLHQIRLKSQRIQTRRICRTILCGK